MSCPYPVGANGQWHGGIHRKGSSPVRAELPGEIAAYRLSDGLMYSRLPKRVSHADKDALPPELRQGGFTDKNLNCWIPPSRNKGKDEELLRALGLCMSGDFFLLRHTLRPCGSAEKESFFYSLYMHLRTLSGIPPRGSFKVPRGIEDLPFGEEPPFYIRYRFRGRMEEEPAIRCETRDTKKAVFLPSGLTVSANLHEMLDMQEKYETGKLSPDTGEYVLPPTFTGHGSAVCLIRRAFLFPAPITDDGKTRLFLQNIEIRSKSDAALYVKRPGGVPVQAGVFPAGAAAVCNVQPYPLVKNSGARYVPVSRITRMTTSPELTAAAGYFPVKNLAEKPAGGKPVKVLRGGMIFVPWQGKSGRPGKQFFFSTGDSSAAEREARECTDPLGLPVFPVMYVRAGDYVECLPDTKEFAMRAAGVKPARVPCVKVHFSLQDSGGLYIREDEAPPLVFYYTIRKPMYADDAETFIRRRGISVFREPARKTLVDFIDAADSPADSFFVMGEKPFSGAQSSLEIIRCGASGSPGTRGYIKKQNISRYCVEWDFSPLLRADGSSACLTRNTEAQYPDAGKRPLVKPGDILGFPGKSETEEALVHVEVFMKNKDAPGGGNGAAPFFQKIPAGTRLYALSFPAPVSTLFKAQTDLETVPPEKDASGRELYPVSRKIRIKGSPEAGSFWIRYNDTGYAGWNLLDTDTLHLEKDTYIGVYPRPAELVTGAEELVETTAADLYIPKEDLCGPRCVFDANGTAYWAGYPEYDAKTGSRKYIRLADDFPIGQENWRESFTLLDRGKLEGYTRARGKTAFLKEALEKEGLSPRAVKTDTDLRGFLANNETLLKTCAFEHPSEWSAKRAGEIQPPYREEYAELCTKLAVWDSSGRNGRLPEDIQNGEELLYFHPEEFISRARLSMGVSFRIEILKHIQDLAITTRSLQKGGTGINDVRGSGKGHDNKVTFCNMATYVILRATDSNYTNFTGIEGLPWLKTHLYGKDEDRFLYFFKTTNVWHDIMLEHSKNSASTGLVELGPEQAQEYANIGYTVVGAWRNPENGKSPHYVTVRPGHLYDTKNGPVAANIGEFNGISWMRVVHGSRMNEYRWFCNFRQGFIKNIEDFHKTEGYEMIQELKERRK